MIILSIILLVVGITIRLTAIKTNKEFGLSLKKPAKLCMTGIYKYIRHPSYMGSMLMITGLYLLEPAIAFVYFVFIFFLARSIEEENILKKHFNQYKDYMKKTKRFIPKIL